MPIFLRLWIVFNIIFALLPCSIVWPIKFLMARSLWWLSFEGDFWCYYYLEFSFVWLNCRLLSLYFYMVQLFSSFTFNLFDFLYFSSFLQTACNFFIDLIWVFSLLANDFIFLQLLYNWSLSFSFLSCSITLLFSLFCYFLCLFFEKYTVVSVISGFFI